MKTLKKAIVYYASAPLDLFVAFPMVLIVRLLWGERLRWRYGVLSVLLKSGSYPLGGETDVITGFLKFKKIKIWPLGFYLTNRKAAVRGQERPKPWSGTAIGHGHLYSPYMRGNKSQTSVEVHELHHTLQAEVDQLYAMFFSHVLLIVGFITESYVTGLILFCFVWLFGGSIAIIVAGWIVAFLNSHKKGVYMGSAHEIGAYAVGDLFSLEKEKRKNEKRSITGDGHKGP
jgi:hypothetical protein